MENETKLDELQKAYERLGDARERLGYSKKGVQVSFASFILVIAGTVIKFTINNDLGQGIILGSVAFSVIAIVEFLCRTRIRVKQ